MKTSIINRLKINLEIIISLFFLLTFVLISKIFDSFFEYKCFNEKNGAILCVTQIRNYNTQCCAWVCTCIHISKNIEVSHKCLDAKKVSACMIDDTIFFFYRFSALQQRLHLLRTKPYVLEIKRSSIQENMNIS